MHGQQNIKIATKAPCVHNVTRNFSNKRYEVITEVLYRSHVLWEVSCCQLVISHWHFEVSYCLHSHGEALQSITILGLLGPEHERPAILRNFFHYLPSQRLNVPQVLVLNCSNIHGQLNRQIFVSLWFHKIMGLNTSQRLAFYPFFSQKTHTWTYNSEVWVYPAALFPILLQILRLNLESLQQNRQVFNWLLLDCGVWVTCLQQTDTPTAYMSTPFNGCEVQIATDASQVRQLLLAKLLAETRWTNYGKQVTI